MSTLLDVAIGLLVVFLIFSIVVSGVNEWLAQAFGRRGAYLHTGMARLINDAAIFSRVLHHPLIGSLYRTRATQGKPPSYVDSRNFALAIADVLLARANGNYSSQQSSDVLSVAALQRAIVSPALAASPIGVAVGPILEQAGGDLGKALSGIEAWFNSGMDRVEGWYKARTNKMLFTIGLAVAVLCNIDTIEIYRALNASTPLRASLLANAEDIVATGKLGNAPIASAQGKPLTPEEQQSLHRFINTLVTGAPTSLPIGYACLNATGNDLALTNVEPGIRRTAAKLNPFSNCWREFETTNANRSATAWIIKLAGWTLSALAGTLGASYWFALLTKVVNIRDSGSKPARTKDHK